MPGLTGGMTDLESMPPYCTAVPCKAGDAIIFTEVPPNSAALHHLTNTPARTRVDDTIVCWPSGTHPRNTSMGGKRFAQDCLLQILPDAAGLHSAAVVRKRPPLVIIMPRTSAAWPPSKFTLYVHELTAAWRCRVQGGGPIHRPDGARAFDARPARKDGIRRGGGRSAGGPPGGDGKTVVRRRRLGLM
jgi:hypothetical protein